MSVRLLENLAKGSTPRMRGIGGGGRKTCLVQQGTTPHVRGIAGIYITDSGQGRNNPACAGNTPPDPAPAQPSAEQPRVCGE